MSSAGHIVENMKILHTSDWHLGRGFHGTSLREEQTEMLSRLCAEVEEQQIDLVLVAGDVYDRALPPEWAVKLLDDTLYSLTQAGAQVVVTPGNHDSAQRLGFTSRLTTAAGVHLRTQLADAWTPVSFTQEDGSQLLVYGVPYLEPQLCAEELGLQKAHHTSVMTEVLNRIRQDAADRGESATTVVMAHLFAARGIASESERNIGAPAVPEESLDHHEETVGGLAVVPLELFEGFDYVALGHLHGRQRLAERIRYSGSPLRYSFSEESQGKGAWLIESTELADPGSAITGLDWQIGREVKRLKGELDSILDPATVQRWSEAFVQITLTDDERPERAYQRLREVYPHLMQYSYAGAATQREATTYSKKFAEAATELDLVASFLDHVRHRSADDEELALVEQALQEARTA